MTFKECLWAAAMAGWWAALIGFGLLLVWWFLYLLIIRGRLRWVAGMWGGEPGIDEVFAQRTVLISFGIFKLIVLIIAMISLWLTLWWWQLG